MLNSLHSGRGYHGCWLLDPCDWLLPAGLYAGRHAVLLTPRSFLSLQTPAAAQGTAELLLRQLLSDMLCCD
jgi:hypothetical protein